MAFIKYVPVKERGSIKKGDHFQLDGLSSKLMDAGWRTETVYVATEVEVVPPMRTVYVGEMKIDDALCVKLECKICTREIHVGDTGIAVSRVSAYCG